MAGKRVKVPHSAATVTARRNASAEVRTLQRSPKQAATGHGRSFRAHRFNWSQPHGRDGCLRWSSNACFATGASGQGEEDALRNRRQAASKPGAAFLFPPFPERAAQPHNEVAPVERPAGPSRGPVCWCKGMHARTEWKENGCKHTQKRSRYGGICRWHYWLHRSYWS